MDLVFFSKKFANSLSPIVTLTYSFQLLIKLLSEIFLISVLIAVWILEKVDLLNVDPFGRSRKFRRILLYALPPPIYINASTNWQLNACDSLDLLSYNKFSYFVLVTKSLSSTSQFLHINITTVEIPTVHSDNCTGPWHRLHWQFSFTRVRRDCQWINWFPKSCPTFSCDVQFLYTDPGA